MKVADHSNPGELSIIEPLSFFGSVVLFIITLVVAYGDINVGTTAREAAQFALGFVMVASMIKAAIHDMGSTGAEVK